MYDPKIGVSSSQARMSVYAPDISFKTPTVDISGGDAYTAGPANYDTEAYTSTTFQDPKFNMQGVEW